MKLALLLTILLVLLPGIPPEIVHAEQLNYTSMIATWAQKLHPGQTSSFVVKEVIDLGVEQTGTPNGELAMWVVLTVNSTEENHIVIISGKKVSASKPFDPSKPEPESNEGPSCSPEEHEQHHGKQQT